MDKVLFFGLGRIGLPQALVFANKGFQVYGFDIDFDLITSLNEGKIPFNEPKMAEYLKKNIHHNFFPLSSWQALFDHLPEIKTVIFTIGTKAINAEEALSTEQFDLSEHYSLLDKIFAHRSAHAETIELIIRTTFPLGATDRMRNYLETKHGLREGKDFYLAFVPERIVVGSAIREEETLPKIIGTYSKESFDAISKLFQKIGGPIVRVSNPITAEFCKLTDNSFRDTVFAYSNEIALHAAQHNIDVMEVINAVNDHYARNKIPEPGYVSGYCLGKDPYIFEINFLPVLPQRDFHSLWYYGRKTNDYLITYTSRKILEHLSDPAEGFVAVLGLSFKENVDDFRMSDSFTLIEDLINSGVKKFKLYDPNLEIDKYTRIPPIFSPYIFDKTAMLTPEFFNDVNSIIICHKHRELIELKEIKKLRPLLALVKNPCYLFDACNIWREAEKLPKIIYQGLGYEP